VTESKDQATGRQALTLFYIDTKVTLDPVSVRVSKLEQEVRLSHQETRDQAKDVGKLQEAIEGLRTKGFQLETEAGTKKIGLLEQKLSQLRQDTCEQVQNTSKVRVEVVDMHPKLVGLDLAFSRGTNLSRECPV